MYFWSSILQSCLSQVGKWSIVTSIVCLSVHEHIFRTTYVTAMNMYAYMNMYMCMNMYVAAMRLMTQQLQGEAMIRAGCRCDVRWPVWMNWTMMIMLRALHLGWLADLAVPDTRWTHPRGWLHIDLLLGCFIYDYDSGQVVHTSMPLWRLASGSDCPRYTRDAPTR